MLPQKQGLKHDLANGVVGDCWRTCIASLINYPREAVPHFLEDCWDDNAKANAKARAWLRDRGFGLVDCAFSGEIPLSQLLAHVAALNPGTYYLLGCTSNNGTGHSVICCDDEIVWDPALDDSGCAGPMSDGLWWVTYLISARALKPA